MWRRLVQRGRSGREQPSSDAPVDEEKAAEAEAEDAIAAWEAAIAAATRVAEEGGAEPTSSPLPGDSPASSGADGGAAYVAHAVYAILAVPKGQRRDEFVARTGRVLERSLLPGAFGDWAQSHLALLREGFDSKELGDALAASLAALSADARLDHFAAVAASCERAREEAALPPEAGGGQAAARNAVEMAAVLQEATSFKDASHRSEELLRCRRALLREAEMGLGDVTAAAETRAAEARAERGRLSERLDALGRAAGGERVGTLGDDSCRLEEEVNRLAERKRELRAEIERLSRQHDDAIARQKAHMTQVDCWRMDKEKVKENSAKSKAETQLEEEAARREEAGCDALVDSIEKIKATMRSATIYAEEGAAATAGKADEHIGAAATAVVRATEARLELALKVAGEVLAEHRRAKSTLELLEVQAPTADLPTRAELATALATLRDAWASRATLGSVELQRRAEVESFLREASDEEARPGAAPRPTDPLADAKAAWATRWGALGDLAVTLADAAAGQPCRPPVHAEAHRPPGASPAAAWPSAAADVARQSRPEPQHSLPSLDDDDVPLLG